MPLRITESGIAVTAVDRRVAVIGLGCRFAGADSPEAFWSNLLAGEDSITRLPSPDGVAARGLLEDPEFFDAGYFGISPREARLISPQARAFLECSVAALEDAGQDPQRVTGAVGVYGGGGESGYARMLEANRAELPLVSEWEIRVANGPDFLCSRVAYRLGLTGPAVAVQAGCATSLVAVHLAVQGLLSEDCELALAGGVTVKMPSGPGRIEEAAIQADDGFLRAFDVRASGVVGGDGVGVVVLKRFSQAVADGDRIDAVILGSAIGNDGADRIGFTAPSVSGQAAVIERAQRLGGVMPQTCSYVETHGTGTRLGDAVEIAALTKAFGRDGDTAEAPRLASAGQREKFCGIGSVKTNIGHTDAAAGVAGLIKTVLALKHGAIPPSLHFTEPNPEIDFANSPFQVVDRTQEWPNGIPRRAGVSSFSVGGTNAHVVLEEAPTEGALAAAVRLSGPYVLAMSAKTPTALDVVTSQLLKRLLADPDTDLADVAWTLQIGRRELAYRRVAIVSDGADAVRVLAGEEPERLISSPGPVWPEGTEPELFDDPRAAGLRWLTGAAVDWAALYQGQSPRRIALPTYPFERQIFTVGLSNREQGATFRSDGPLSKPDPKSIQSGGAKSGTTTYDLVAGLFAEILDLPDVESDESFFDLGGDSLIAIRLAARIRDRYPVELAPSELIAAPTPAELAELVESRLAIGPTQ